MNDSLLLDVHPTSSIPLLVFGGVARPSAMPERDRDEWHEREREMERRHREKEADRRRSRKEESERAIQRS